MMDILTVLLLFLLKSFVADGEVVTPSPDVELPTSESRDALEESLVIAVAEDRISMGGELVTALGPGFRAPDDGDLLIVALADRLEQARAQRDDLAARRGRPDQRKNRVTIQGDRSMPFEVLERVMYTCNQSGFHDIALAVLRG